VSLAPAPGDAAPRMRLDKWLWCARFFRSRGVATRFCEEGSVRVNGGRTTKAHHAVRPGDVLTPRRTMPSGPATC